MCLKYATAYAEHCRSIPTSQYVDTALKRNMQYRWELGQPKENCLSDLLLPTLAA